MPKKTDTKEVIEKIFDYTLEDIMGERFGSYSKYIIQDRAIPDARDGLKPVQRRILYSMHKEKNTYDHGYRKSAKTVGDVIGNYHPHGDTSIYDAMVRMSQPWQTRIPYIDMHGNNGSIDGDSPAAYRYTEARLSKIANEMLRDIERNTIEWAPNFDDTCMEPTVLPARFPALLVYGAQGISAGYATNIPTHNLNEIVDATIYRIDHPKCTLEDLMNIVKGPDFPTGGIVEGLEGLKDAYTTGRGRIVVKSKYEVKTEGKIKQIVINEIPFEVNKALLVKKIDDIRIDKKIDGIIEVRDESAADVRVVIDCKSSANIDLIINYLLKNTDMQISYNFNVVAIVNKRPKLLGLQECLDTFIAHQREVIRRRCEFDLAHARARYHIVEGLIKCISILDEVIRVIRASNNRADSKNNLVKEFGFSEEQAEAIITLQLYKLSNTDVVALEEEMDRLEKTIALLIETLEKESKMKSVMKHELQAINKEYVTPRLTEVREEISEIKIDNRSMIPKEDVVVSISKDGYVKRCSTRSYQASTESNMKEGDHLLGLYELNTLDNILIFTDLGNYYLVPVHEIPTCAWKELGKHISNIAKFEAGEEVIECIPVKEFDPKVELILSTKLGMIKKVKLDEFKTSRSLKPIICMKLKGNDKLISVLVSQYNNIFVGTNKGYGLWYDISEVPTVGLKASGVKSINLKDDFVVGVSNFENDSEYLIVVTDKGTAKRVKLSEFDKITRAKRGLLMLKENKSNPHRVVKIFTTSKDYIGIKGNEINILKSTEIPIMDRYSGGSQVVKGPVIDCYIEKVFVKRDDINLNTDNNSEEIIETKKVSLKEIDERLMTIDDFINIDEGNE